MPLLMDGGKILSVGSAEKHSRPLLQTGGFDQRTDCVEVALINNMPDAALEDTETQFSELLNAASGDIPVRLRLFSLPNVPRSERGNQHLSRSYSGIEDLLNGRFDGVIMTGTEPRQHNLRDEPYWSALGNVLDWAEHNSTSTVLSCLAAHAGVLYSDGIERHPLGDKQFGLFDYKKVCDHPLISATAGQVRFPHSRWNEVREDALTSCGYVVLTRSTEAGVDMFVKKKRNSLFVHFQGHPEYSAQTLLKEYRRDIKRFLRRERETYPTMPHGYFDAAATRLLADFRDRALVQRNEDLVTTFPESSVVATLQNTWRSSSISVYRNWLQYLVSKKVETTAFVAVSRAGRAPSRPANRELT